MQTARLLVPNRLIIRKFCVSCINHGNYAGREARFLSKIIHSRSKRKWYNSHESISSPALLETTKKEPSMHVQRRMTVLNKIFMEHITDFMSTGDAGSELLDRNIEVSHIKVSPDFKLINVFWIDNAIDPESYAISTEELLNSAARLMRHELSQLRVIGSVPPIHFVKCKHIDTLREVERRLQKADFGEDFEPSVYPYTPNTLITYKSKSEKCEESNTSESKDSERKELREESPEEIFSITLPAMRHDVFGLDWHRVMTKIKVNLEKSKAVTRKQLQRTKMNVTEHDTLDAQTDKNFMTEEQQMNEFSEFLVWRQKEDRRRNKMKYKCKKNHNVLSIDTEYDDAGYDSSYDTDYTSDEEYDDYDNEP